MKKFLLTVMGLLNFSEAYAQSSCTYFALPRFNVCRDASNGVDLNHKVKDLQQININSDWFIGGQDQIEICKKVEFNFNFENSKKGLFGTLVSPGPTNEKSQRTLGIVTYQYTCTLNVAQYSFRLTESPACGNQSLEVVAFDRASANMILSRPAKCLTCNEERGQGNSQYAKCVISRAKQILDTPDLRMPLVAHQAFKETINDLLMLNRMSAIPELSQPQNLDPITAYLKKY